MMNSSYSVSKSKAKGNNSDYLVSIVVPIFNEVDSVPILHKKLHDALDGKKRGWEVVFVDDGSSDGSSEAIEKLIENDPEHTRFVALRRNFGQTAAISAGIDFTNGEVVVLMDGDLQNDPADIPKLLTKIDEGYDLVSGWRKDRKDNFITRTFPSRIANWIISRVTGVYLHDYGCTLKAYRREVLTGFRLYGEMHRFIPAYAGYVGARITEITVRHHPRKYGKTSYGLDRSIKVVLDLLTVKFLSGYINKPIYLFGGTGLGMGGLGVIGLIYLFIRKFMYGAGVVSSPIFLLSALLFVLGVLAILLGLLAEMMVRTYHESQSKPIYNVRYTMLAGDDQDS
jgi:glycosyltransferase involved in cell wall biosynthesis